jgi:nucleoside-diphosphate-sugar epimerase
MAIYLVTGVAGFIGARVAEMLIAADHLVVGVDSLNDYYDFRLKSHRVQRLLRKDRSLEEFSENSLIEGSVQLTDKEGRFIFRQLNIENGGKVRQLFTEYSFDGVFHLAARAGVRHSIDYPHKCLATNAAGTLNILESQRQSGVRKHVLASTSSLYSGCPLPFTEDQPANTPLSPYAASKKAAEMMAYSYHKLHALDITVLRYFTVYGPAGRPDMSIFRFIKSILEETQIELHGDGSQARDFTYIDDIARGTIMSAIPLGYEVINLGAGDAPIDLRTLIVQLEQLTGKQARIKSTCQFHPTEIGQTQASIEKAAKILHWSPKIKLAEGLRHTVGWFLENREWLRQIRL